MEMEQFKFLKIFSSPEWGFCQ